MTSCPLMSAFQLAGEEVGETCDWPLLQLTPATRVPASECSGPVGVATGILHDPSSTRLPPPISFLFFLTPFNSIHLLYSLPRPVVPKLNGLNRTICTPDKPKTRFPSGGYDRQRPGAFNPTHLIHTLHCPCSPSVIRLRFRASPHSIGTVHPSSNYPPLFPESIMSSSIAMSSVAMTRPGTTRPVLSQLVATHTSRSHGIWRSARNYHSIRDKMERIARSIDKYQRHPQANLRSKTEACKGWATHWPRSRFSELAGREKTYWDAQHEQMNHRIAQLKRQVAKDPYGAIFGGRLVQSSHYIDQSDTATAWPGFLRTFLGAEKPTTEHPSKPHLQDFNFTQSPARSSTSGSRDTLEYDPISGRMAPKAPQPQARSESTMQSSNAGVDCPTGSGVEAKFAPNSSTAEDSQFQPGSISTAKLDAMKSQTTDCPPGSEMEALFISESVPSEKPQSETLKVQTKAKNLSAPAGLISGQNVECAPGSEPEALFTAKPATWNDQSRPPQEFGYHPSANVSVDCPLGSELEAQFAAQLAKDCNSEQEATPVDCSPGSELEARIVAETTRAQLSDPTVDCAPGSESEAFFATNPAAVQATHYPPTIATADSDSKQAGITVDCGPGSELEAKFPSGAASTGMRGESEDLTALHASDIRARYTLKSDDDTSIRSRSARDVEFNASEDHVGDFLQTQPSTSTLQWSEADYRILAYDTTTSTVTTTSADTFFGTNPPLQPHEILSRLNNPAKFVPYFVSMQKDGYELATGGGDILVFKRSANNNNTTKSTAAAGQHEQEFVSEDVRDDIARYRCHDSFDSTAYVGHYNPSSTFEVSGQ